MQEKRAHSLRDSWATTVEQLVDAGVKRAVARLLQPLEKQIASLRTRVEELQRSVDERRRRNGE